MSAVLAVLESSTQRAVAVVIAVFAMLAWLFFVVYENRRPGAEGAEKNARQYFGAPNRKRPPDDDTFEGPRLDRFLGWALWSMAIVAFGLPFYWLGEPGRIEGSNRGFNIRSVHRGEGLFRPSAEGGFGCADCHGVEGVGGVTQWNLAVVGDEGKVQLDPQGKDVLAQVQWLAPAVNRVALRYKYGQLRNVLVFGRGANKPMPAWGLAGGGPMNDQQIDDLIHYLRELALESDEAFKHAFEEELKLAKYEDWDKVFDKVVANGLGDAEAQKNSTENLEAANKAAEAALTTAKGALAKNPGDEDAIAALEKADASNGKSEGQVIFEQNCARCHTKGWSYQTPNTPYDTPNTPGGGWYGPNLTGKSTVRQFPNKADHIEFVKNGVEDNKSYGTGGVQKFSGGGMPYFANTLTDEQIAAVVDYERGL